MLFGVFSWCWCASQHTHETRPSVSHLYSVNTAPILPLSYFQMGNLACSQCCEQVLSSSVRALPKATVRAGMVLTGAEYCYRAFSQPATTSNEEDNVWLRQGRARAQTRESTRATRLTHPHTTPPNNKQNSTAQHTEPSPAAQRAKASAAQAQQRRR